VRNQLDLVGCAEQQLAVETGAQEHPQFVAISNSKEQPPPRISPGCYLGSFLGYWASLFEPSCTRGLRRAPCLSAAQVI